MLVVYLVLSVALIVFATAKLKIHPFLVLLFVALTYGFLADMPVDQLLQSVNQGFGGTLGGIGLIIILGVIIGAFLEASGGAYAIAQKVLNTVGKKNVPSAMGAMGYVISIPVFADSGFMLFSALNRSLCKKAGITLAGSAIALGLGLTVSHNLIPPTPGPIAAAGILGADLGLILIIGIPVSLVSLTTCIFFAIKFVSKIQIDPAPEVSEAELDSKITQAPSAFKSSLPIFVPIILIIGKSLTKAIGLEPSALQSIIYFLGEPFIALFIGVGFAVLLPSKFEWHSLSSDGIIAKALSNAASIIMITGAGGIFGKVLFNSGIADVLGTTLSQWNIGLFLPFLLAASLKTAQGSSTVALITTASILAPLMESLGFVNATDRALVVLAIGAGSAVISHANDSFFWVVTQMSAMDVKTGYRTHSLGTLLIGLSAILTLYAISFFI